MWILLLACAARPLAPAPDAVTIAVMGDLPYADDEWSTFRDQVYTLNTQDVDAVVHVGDIKTGGSACEEPVYAETAAILAGSTHPTLILVGDNEWNDCGKGDGPGPDAGWSHWQTHLAPLNDAWSGPPVRQQPGHPQNRAWDQGGVRFVTLLLPGGRVHDDAAWQAFLQADADWITEQVGGADTDAVVVLGHANPNDTHRIVIDALQDAARSVGVPVLYVHGDGHVWQDKPGWGGVPNLRRVQVDQGGKRTPAWVRAGAAGVHVDRGERIP